MGESPNTDYLIGETAWTGIETCRCSTVMAYLYPLYLAGSSCLLRSVTTGITHVPDRGITERIRNIHSFLLVKTFTGSPSTTELNIILCLNCKDTLRGTTSHKNITIELWPFKNMCLYFIWIWQTLDWRNWGIKR